jgi:hypothetical protein
MESFPLRVSLLPLFRQCAVPLSVITSAATVLTKCDVPTKFLQRTVVAIGEACIILCVFWKGGCNPILVSFTVFVKCVTARRSVPLIALTVDTRV